MLFVLFFLWNIFNDGKFVMKEDDFDLIFTILFALVILKILKII